jgi:hypothetical protein
MRGSRGSGFLGALVAVGVTVLVRRRRELDAVPHPPIATETEPATRRALERHYRDWARAVRRLRRRRAKSGGAKRSAGHNN